MTDITTAVGEPVVAPVAPATGAAVVAPVVAPVHLEAPVTPPVAAPVAVVAAGSEIAYEATGDAGLDVALSFVGKLGFTGDHPAMAAAAKGDFGLIKAQLATLGDKATGWEQMVALAEQSFKAASEKATAADAALTATVNQVAGSAENWAAVHAWSKANATEAERVQINAMFDAGPVGAKAAAQLLVDIHAKAQGTVVTPTTATRSAGAQTAAISHGPLTAHQYGAEVRALHNKLGNRMEASPEYRDLRARLNRG